jgi:hypothetical protein
MACRRLVQLTLFTSLIAPTTGSWAGNGCAGPLVGPLRDVQKMIASLRADSNPPNRMIGQNGLAYTFAQVSWMQDQLNMVDDACRHGREVEATWRVEALQVELGAGGSFGDKSASAIKQRRHGMLAVGSK